MYVTPRPSGADDPLYAVRLAMVGMLSYAAIPLLDPALRPMIAALPVGLIGAQRKAFSVGKAIGGPVAMVVPSDLMTGVVEWLRPMPLYHHSGRGRRLCRVSGNSVCGQDHRADRVCRRKGGA